MPTLFGRRYARDAQSVSRTEKLLGLFILLLTAGVVTAFVVHVTTSRYGRVEVAEEAYVGPTTQLDQAHTGVVTRPAAVAETLLPASGLEDWDVPTRVERFAADELYVKIDGRAAAYIKSGVVGLTFGRYVHTADPGRAIDVYWYDMGTAANARSMYDSEKPADVTAIMIEDAAYQVGGAVFLHVGASYVQVLPTTLDEDDAQAALRIAERLARVVGEKGRQDAEGSGVVQQRP